MILSTLNSFILSLLFFNVTCALISSERCRKSQVVIIGAGVAGITAAQTLHQKGIDDFVIMEYNDEIGGRNRHTKFGKGQDGKPFTIELGSNWVQEINENNPIWLLMKKYNIKHHISNYNSYDTYDATGRADWSATIREFNQAAHKVTKQAQQIVEQDLPDQILRASLTEAGWQPQFNPAAQAYEWWTYDFEIGAPTEQSSQVFGVGVTLPHDAAPGIGDTSRDLYVDDQRGFNIFVHGEASTFLSANDSRLLLSTPVTGINYSASEVVISTANRAIPCIKASHAILTVSLGVLQASLAGKPLDGAIKFSPALPPWKTKAISAFGMATYTKIFLQFPASKVFWPQDKQYFLWADPTVRGNYPAFQSLDLPGFLPGSGIIFPTATTPNAARVEAQSDSTTKQQCLEILRQMFGAENVPEPSAFMYPRWGEYPWARGSYSYWPAGVTLQQHENLRGTLEGRLWFAGEATSAENYGYLHGAWFEGRAAANDVAECMMGNEVACNGRKFYARLNGTNGVKNLNKGNGFRIDELTKLEREKLSGGNI